MRTIIAGGRDMTDYSLVVDAVSASGFVIHKVISGGAKGINALGELLAKRRGIRVKIFKADWTKFGVAAGPIRNREMAQYANEHGDGQLIAIWDGKSPGTKNMIETARSLNLKIYVHRVRKDGRFWICENESMEQLTENPDCEKLS